MNRSGRPILSVDIPSGLSDEGRPRGIAVRATWTLTLGAPKVGLVLPEAGDYVGEIEVVDIGIPPQMFRTRIFWVTAEGIRSFFPRRPRTAHKGSFGHLLLVGGS